MLSSQDRRTWTVDDHTLKGSHVYNAVHDTRTGRPFAADNGSFFGSFVRYSDDLGASWQEPERGIEFPEETGQKLGAIWLIEPGRRDEPQTLYAGVDPASLDQQGRGRDLGPGARVVRPSHAGPLAAGIRWTVPALDRAGQIEPLPNVGRDLGGGRLAHRRRRRDLELQEPQYASRFLAGSFSQISDALDPFGVYVGTNTGQLFATADAGDSWQLIADFLPPVFSVTASLIP